MPGALGTVAGVTAADRADCGLLPTAFTAATVNVYVVPLVRPVTFRLVAVGPAVTVRIGVAALPTKTRTSKRVIGDPPLLAGAVKLTTAEAFPLVTAPMV